MIKSGNSPNPQAMGMGRKVAWVVAGIVCLLVALLGLTPLLVSHGWGKKWLERTIGKSLDGSLSIGEVSLNWLSSQSLKGISFRDHKGDVIFNCPSITGSNPLWKVVFTKDLGEWDVSAPQYALRTPLQKHMDLTIAPKEINQAGLLPQVHLAVGWGTRFKGYFGKAVVTDGKIHVLAPNVDPIMFEQIAMTAVVPQDGDRMEVVLTCHTLQQQMQGNVNIAATLSDLRAEIPSIKAKATLNQLPVRGIDQIVSQFHPPMDGLLLGLMGPTIDMNFNINSADTNFILDLEANSPQFSAHLSTEGVNGIVSLANPGLIKLTMPPSSFAKFSQLIPTLKEIVLTQPATFLLNVSELSMVIPKKWEDLKSLTLQASLSSAPASTWRFNQNQTFVLQNCEVNISSPDLLQGVSSSGQLTGTAEGQPIQVSYEVELTQLFSDSITGKGTVQINQLPIALAGELAGLSFPLSDFLGPFLNASAEFDLSGSVEIAANTSLLQIPKTRFSMTQGISLLEPVHITYVLLPNEQLTDKTTLQCTVEKFSLPTLNALDQLKLSLIAVADKIAFKEVPHPFQNIQGILVIHTLDSVSASLNSTTIKASVEGGFNQSSQFLLKKPFLLEAIIDNALYQQYISQQAILTHDATVSLTVEPFALPLDLKKFNQLKINGLATISSLDFAMADRSQTIALVNTQAPFQLDGYGKTGNFQCTATVQTPKQSNGTLTLNGTISNVTSDLGLSQANIEINGNLEQIPSSLLSAFASVPNPAALIGQNFNCSFKTKSTPKIQSLAIQTSSPNLTVNASFTADDQILQGNQGQAIWTLTPEGYQFLDQMLITGNNQTPPPFVLKEPAIFQFTVANFSIPLQPRQKTQTLFDRFPMMPGDLSQLKLVASGKNALLKFSDTTTSESIQLMNSNFSFNRSQIGGPIQLAMNSAVTSQKEGGTQQEMAKSGSLNVSASIDRLFNDQGETHIEDLSGQIALTASQFPSRVLDLIARTRGKTNLPFSTIFGETINTELKAQLDKMTGPVSLTLNSPLSRASLQGKLIKGALTLDKPLHAQGTITKEISRLMLTEVNPLSLSYLYTNTPITLEISNTDFYLPLFPFNANRINIPQARLEFGQIYCRNEGNINTTLSLLKIKDFAKDKEVMLWFAPIDLHVSKGLVDVERTEILIANSLDIAIWGSVDIAKDYVDMLLGLPAKTLQKAFGLKGLPENYVLTIPMKGPSDNVQINTSKATTKVAMLLAWQQGGSILGETGGSTGALIGGFLGKLATLPDKDAKVPPAKHPFPWEVGKGSSKKPTSHADGKRRHFKSKEKPLKQLLKVIR